MAQDEFVAVHGRGGVRLSCFLRLRRSGGWWRSVCIRPLTGLDNSYRLYPRRKGGAGRSTGYRMTTLSHVDALRSAGSVVAETRQYHALDVVERTSLTGMLFLSCIWDKPRP